MSSRGLLCVVDKEGEYRVSQYCRDASPETTGTNALNFLSGEDSEKRKNLLLSGLKKCRYVSIAERSQMWADIGVDIFTDNVSDEKHDEFIANHPYFSKNLNADILSVIISDIPGIDLISSLEFVGDCLFCEWVYVIDFSKNTFEVYQGMNTEPLGEGERFRDFAIFDEYKDAEETSYPPRLLVSYSLDNLPTHEAFMRCICLDEHYDEYEI